MATWVTVCLIELPADSAVWAAFAVVSLAVDLALLPVDFARERVAPLADLALPLGDRLPDDLELPPEAARERLEPLLAAALGALPLPLPLPEDLRDAVRPRVAARVLPDPEDPFDDPPEDDFAREDARPDEPRCVVAAISLNLRSGSARGSDLGGWRASAIPVYPRLRWRCTN
jgi:hypothetical protein